MAEHKLSSGKVAEVVGIRGREERKLLNDLQAKRLTAFDDLMAACCKSLDGVKVESVDDVLDLHSGDRLALLLYIRWETFGPDVEFTFTCPRCFTKNPMSASLAEIDFERPLVLDTGPFLLARAKKEVTWELPTGHTERYLAKLNRGSVSTIDLTHLIQSRKVKLAGEILKEAQLDDLEAADRSALLSRLSKVGGPDSVIDGQCSSCNHDHHMRFEMLPDFFFPGVVPR